MNRRLHFVGSLPDDTPDDDRGRLLWPVEHTAGHQLTALPRDLDADWIVAYLKDIATRDTFKVVHGGGYTGYEDLTAYQVAAGHQLTPGDVAMRRTGRIRDVLAAFRALRSDHPELSGLRLQVSQPNPLDMALFVFATPAVRMGLPLGPALRRGDTIATALRYLPLFEQAVVDEITELTATSGDELVWQIESPLALLGMVKAASIPGAAPVAGRLLASQLARLLAALPAGADTMLHLCYGDYGHTSLLKPHNLAPVVSLLNPLATTLHTRGLTPPPVHIPCGHGPHPAPLTPDFYQPLTRLDQSWRLIAGVVSEDDVAGAQVALDAFEHAAGRTAWAVATPCGLGRRTLPDAGRAATAMATVADSGVSRGLRHQAPA